VLTNVGKGPTSAANGAAQAADEVLRVTYLDLARRWRKMAHEAELLERKATPHSRTGVRSQRFETQPV